MSIGRTLIYASSNGDCWYLCTDEDAAVFILHEPNLPSGGAASCTELSAFLASGTHAPEQRALLTMIATLVEPAQTDVSTCTVGPEPGAAGAEPSPGEAATAV